MLIAPWIGRRFCLTSEEDIQYVLAMDAYHLTLHFRLVNGVFPFLSYVRLIFHRLFFRMVCLNDQSCQLNVF